MLAAALFRATRKPRPVCSMSVAVFSGLLGAARWGTLASAAWLLTWGKSWAKFSTTWRELGEYQVLAPSRMPALWLVIGTIGGVSVLGSILFSMVAITMASL